MPSITYTCPNIRCGGCASAITEALSGVPGVAAVSVDVAAKAVHVSFDDAGVTAPAVEAALAQAGFPPAAP
ncbi:MAG TPA: heavy-metal-associated domain-containing protein [Armatimonadota bacterium]|jgi:copper chaperone CopZ